MLIVTVHVRALFEGGFILPNQTSLSAPKSSWFFCLHICHVSWWGYSILNRSHFGQTGLQPSFVVFFLWVEYFESEYIFLVCACWLVKVIDSPECLNHWLPINGLHPYESKKKRLKQIHPAVFIKSHGMRQYFVIDQNVWLGWCFIQVWLDHLFTFFFIVETFMKSGNVSRLFVIQPVW